MAHLFLAPFPPIPNPEVYDKDHNTTTTQLMILIVKIMIIIIKSKEIPFSHERLQKFKDRGKVI